MPHSSAFTRRWLVGTAALPLLLAFVFARPAYAEIRGTDLLGDRAVASSSALKVVAPNVVAPSGVLETSDGQVLWARDADVGRAMASTTKIMTAIIVLDDVRDLSEMVTVPAEATTLGEADVGLRAGQQLSVRQLLEAMLVHSGNDAAITLAVHVGGSVDGFVKLMNEKAASLDLGQTRFTNPHGLDESGHHASADDLATMAQYAMRNATFREIVGMRSVSLTIGGTRRRFDASNLLLGSFGGATGVKTGWTDEAGYCLVASAQRGGTELFAVVLGTKSETARFAEARRLLSWGFEHYGIRAVTTAEETAALVAVTDYLDRTVPAVVAETTSTAIFDVLGDVTTSASVAEEVQAPVDKGQRLGTLSVEQSGRLIAQVPIVSAAAVAAPDGWERFRIGVTRLWRTAFGGQVRAAPVTMM
ncbi:MAG: D-alanyl-D-alanine carboxypeptidase [Actinomycetia bacterium]|nr:D-alanyl-D-alanine carboxypeptidase [Actinomycetes bacterium]